MTQITQIFADNIINKFNLSLFIHKIKLCENLRYRRHRRSFETASFYFRLNASFRKARFNPVAFSQIAAVKNHLAVFYSN